MSEEESHKLKPVERGVTRINIMQGSYLIEDIGGEMVKLTYISEMDFKASIPKILITTNGAKQMGLNLGGL